MRLLYILLCLSLSFCVWAQPLGMVRGCVMNAENRQSVTDATVFLKPISGAATELKTDDSGCFRSENVAVGRYLVTVSRVGFELWQEELVVVSGQETVREVLLRSNAGSAGVEIVAVRRSEELGVTQVSYDDIMRFPAAYEDPARMLQGSTGVTGNYDGANGLIIRGLSPDYSGWAINGIDVLNPNHLSNAGTFSDFATQSAGGTSSISAQMIDRATLYKNLTPTDIHVGNSFSGTLDVQLRKGNDEHMEYTAQLGLIGTELAIEGPIQKGRSSFLLNYRYSTVGILGLMGVDFGGEKITFQDIAGHLHFKIGKNGSLSLWNISGKSSNIYEHMEDSTQWLLDKHSRDINYYENQTLSGLNFNLPIGKRSFWETKIGYSAKNVDRTAFEGEQKLSDQQLNLKRFVAQTAFGYRSVSGRFSGKTGMVYINPDFNNPDENTKLIKFYQRLEFRPSSKLRLGAQAAILQGDDNDFELVLRAAYRLSKQHSLHLEGGRQVLQNSGYRCAGCEYVLNLTGFQSAEAAYQFTGNKVAARVSLFSKVAIFGITNYGAESEVNWFPRSDVFVSAGIVRYRTINGDVEDRYSGVWATNLAVSKEWTKQKNDRKTRTWGVSIRGQANRGLRYNVIDQDASRVNGTTIYQDVPPELFDRPYFRTDARVYLRRFRRGYTSTLALDIQNLTNQQNLAWQYYDKRADDFLNVYQLGTIPMLSYRVEF